MAIHLEPFSRKALVITSLYIHVKPLIKYQNNFDDVQFCVNNINRMLTKTNINSGQMLKHLKADTLGELCDLIIAMRENSDIVKPLKTESFMF